jgi:hypothetical protein
VSKKVKTGAKRQEREDNEARTAKETSKAARQLGKGFVKGGKGDFKGGKGPKAQSAKAAGTGKDGLQRQGKAKAISKGGKCNSGLDSKTAGLCGERSSKAAHAKANFSKCGKVQKRESATEGPWQAASQPNPKAKRSSKGGKSRKRDKADRQKTARRAKMQRGNSGNAVLVKWRGQSASQSSLPLGRNKMDAKSR